ncbi:ribonuclease H-like domain-containing protein [Tanacetum coccineum]
MGWVVYSDAVVKSSDAVLVIVVTASRCICDAVSSHCREILEQCWCSDGDSVSDPTLYRNLAGSLQYLIFTRPDISYAIQHVCLYMHDPREPHFSALKRILWYVRGTLDYGLRLFSSSTTDLVAYSDADWAGCPTTRRSTSGYCVFLETTYSLGPLSVSRRFLVPVKRQSIVVLPMLLLRLVGCAI